MKVKRFLVSFVFFSWKVCPLQRVLLQVTRKNLKTLPELKQVFLKREAKNLVKEVALFLKNTGLVKINI